MCLAERVHATARLSRTDRLVAAVVSFVALQTVFPDWSAIRKGVPGARARPGRAFPQTSPSRQPTHDRGPSRGLWCGRYWQGRFG